MNALIIFVTLSLIFLILFRKKVRFKKPTQLSEKHNKELEKTTLDRSQEVANNNERVTKEQIREVLIQLNLSPFVVGLFDETENLRQFDFYDTFKPPYHIIHCTKKEQEVFEIDRYIPLFETMDDFLEVLAYDNVLNGFIRYCPEYNIPLASYDVLNWDGTFVGQILTWYEDCKTDEEILNVCHLLGLKNGRQILESIPVELGTKYTSEQIGKWEEHTIAKINGRIKPTKNLNK